MVWTAACEMRGADMRWLIPKALAVALLFK